MASTYRFLFHVVLAAACIAAPAAASECASRPAPPATQGGFAAAAERVAPSVVTVLVLRPAAEGDVAARSFSSGFVVAPDGGIVSSAHAVAGAEGVFIEMSDGRRLPARVVGADRRNDVALLHVEADALPVVRAATAPVCAGDIVAALGSPFGFERSVTAGVVSAAGRMLPGVQGVPLIQTDVAMNPGSSGGPLFDAQGAVVGLASMIFSDSGVYMGVSFAVPIDRVLRVVGELRARPARRDGIGAVMQPVTPELAKAFGLSRAAGALVAGLHAGGPAAAAGLRPGDIVLAVDGRAAQGQTEVEDALAAAPAQRAVELRVWREGTAYRIVIAASAPPSGEASGAGAAPAREEERLGLQLAPAPATAKLPAGVHVTAATGSALLAGIESGDRISAVNGTAAGGLREFDAALARAKDAEVVALLVWRGADPLYVAVRRIGR